MEKFNKHSKQTKDSMTQDYDLCIQNLMDLGLTLMQAKLYLVLAKLGKAEVTRIAEASNVARSEVYRVMPALEKLGLVEKILDKTTLYKATPIKEGSSILLQNKRREYSELEKVTSSLLSNFHENDLQDLQEENQQFKVTSEWTLLRKMHKKMILSAQTSIDMTIPEKFFQRMLFDHRRSINRAKKKGVKIRAITQKVGKIASPIEKQALEKNLFTEIKYLSYDAPFGMHIFDKKEVTLSISEKDGVPTLWSNDSNVLKLAEAYFESLWNSTQIKLNNS